MRIYLLSDAGGVPHTRRWARWFADHGHEVHVVSLNDRILPDYGAVTVHAVWTPRFGNALPERALKAPIVLARLWRLFRRYPPDLVHAHSAGGYAWLAMLSGFRPYAVTPWGTDLLVDIERSRTNLWLTRAALRRADLVTTDGSHFLPILARLGVSADRILLHTFGTDVVHFSPGPDQGERKVLGLSIDAPVVISTRTLNPVHDVSTFIEAIPAIHARHPEARFVVVGGGTQERELRERVAALGLDEVTRFTGVVDEARMSRLLRAADIYVSTSTMDAGLAGSTAEAMSSELPVVQTDNSDNAEWTPDSVGGFLVPNGRLDALAERVIRLIEDPALRRAMGERNRAVILERYNRDVEMARVQQAYERLVGTP